MATAAKVIHRHLDPLQQLERLRYTAAPPINDEFYNGGTREIAISNNRGRAVIEWRTNLLGPWDWVGLFAGPSTSWRGFHAGSWLWVGNCRSGVFRTNAAYSRDLQARYMVWDQQLRSFRKVSVG